MAKINPKLPLLLSLIILLMFSGVYIAYAWEPIPVVDDYMVRMPGTQPGNVSLLDSAECLRCHSGYNPQVEPGYNWKGSMMAQSSRDFMFWADITVAAQDTIWAVGTPNAVDLCERCHFPKGWLEGRSDPTNASLMTGGDYNGVECSFCHRLYDPFFEATYLGEREGSDWLGYWDETNLSTTPSQPAADSSYTEDAAQALLITQFNGGQFFADNRPVPTAYTENAAAQFFASLGTELRGPFADASAMHPIRYSRYHKSAYFCANCHDVSNPVLQNLGADPTQILPSEASSAYTYFHIERTFSEFLLSAYGQPGGAPGIGPYAKGSFDTSHPNDVIASCQDCHLPDTTGKAARQQFAVVRPTGSLEHPNSGVPKHSLTGGNLWVSTIMASTVVGSPNFDQVNYNLLNQGPSVLTLDLTQGIPLDANALLDGADRALQNLLNAAAIDNLGLDFTTGRLSFRIQNQTGHKLISGFPEGRRMFANVKVYNSLGELTYEINPYDFAIGTLKGLGVGSSPDLAANEVYVDELVYEAKPSSSLSGEEKTFHFALATGRYKDNRIPPLGFDAAAATGRLAQPVWHGVEDPNYFTGEEYAGGYDQVELFLPPETLVSAAHVEVSLYYQITSREYIEFLRDEINGTGNLTLPLEAYIAQNDLFFSQLKAWGDTLWDLWVHNKDLPGAAPVLMTAGSINIDPPPGLVVSVDAVETGYYDASGIFILATVFNQGSAITFRVRVHDAAAGMPVVGALVTFTITGPEGLTLTATSDQTGTAEATWQTTAPRGQGRFATAGTTTGNYTVTVTDVTATDYQWDGLAPSTTFTIQ